MAVVVVDNYHEFNYHVNVMDNWINISEISRRSGVPETSVRRYINIFNEYLQGRKFGRIQMFHPNACQIISQIAEGYKLGKATEQIEEELREDFTQVVDVVEENHHLTTTKNPQAFDIQSLSSAQIVSTLKQITKILKTLSRQLESQQHNNEKLTTAIDKIASKLEARHYSNKDLKGLEEELGKTKEAQKRQEKEIMWMTSEWFSSKKTWWKRILNR